jgi:hypothetical protein
VASAEQIVYSLLSGVASGAVYPLKRPTLTTCPAVVTHFLWMSPEPTLSQSAGANLYTARVQADCFEQTYAGLKTLVDAVRAAVHLKSGVFAGKTLASSVLDMVSQDEYDSENSIFAQSVVFQILYYD